MSECREEWRLVVGYEAFYAVSSLGRIKRIACGQGTSPGRILKPRPKVDGRLSVVLSLGKGVPRPQETVHTLVAEAFLGPRPSGFQINHIDGAPTNNCASNLEYTTRQGNMDHAVSMGLIAFGERNGSAKLTEKQVREIRDLRLARGLKLHELATLFGVSKMTISRTVRGELWRHVA